MTRLLLAALLALGLGLGARSARPVAASSGCQACPSPVPLHCDSQLGPYCLS